MVINEMKCPFAKRSYPAIHFLAETRKEIRPNDDDQQNDEEDPEAGRDH